MVKIIVKIFINNIKNITKTGSNDKKTKNNDNNVGLKKHLNLLKIIFNDSYR